MTNSSGITQDDRTTAVGLYHYGLSYQACAEQLRCSPPDDLAFDAPIRFLYWHTSELFMKAFLRAAGLGVRELRDIGHRLGRLHNECVERGLPLGSYPSAFFDFTDEAEPLEARYIVTGYREGQASLGALSQLCGELQEAVRADLQKRNLPVR
jgi:hypothetical protein